jgi:hypothetical protein
MSYVGNGPQAQTVLRLEARKSFALGLEIRDNSARVLDITGASFQIVMKALPLSLTDTTDDDNLITNSFATIIDAGGGIASFFLQATDLNHAPGEYPYSIVMISAGYSSVIISGVIELQANTEFSSLSSVYVGTNTPISLTLELEGGKTINVFTGVTLAPGTTSFTDGDKDKLDGIEAGAQLNINSDWAAEATENSFIVNKPVLGTAAYYNIENIGVPRDGSPGQVLMKVGNGEEDYDWAVPPIGPGPGNLTAVAVLTGRVPTANGADSWTWQPVPSDIISAVAGRTGNVVLNLDDSADTSTRVAMLPAERTKLTGLTATPAWSSLLGVPAFGSAALVNTTAFLAPLAVTAADVVSGVLANGRVPRVTELRGFTSGTSAPTGGADGDLYFQYTA